MTSCIAWETVHPSIAMTPMQFLRDNITMLDREIADRLEAHGIPASVNQVQMARRRIGLLKTGGPGSHPIVSDSHFETYNQPLRVEADRICVIGDMEAPFHHADFLNRVLDICDALRIKTLVLAGDFLHNDNLSSFEPNWQNDPEEGLPPEARDELIWIAQHSKGKVKAKAESMIDKYDDHKEKGRQGLSVEWEHARKTLREMRSVFEVFYAALGNHEGRLLRQLNSPITPSEIRQLLANGEDWFKIAPYYFCNVVSGGVAYRVTHPKNTSVIPGQIARQLCEKFKTNVIQAHNHLWNRGQSPSGDYLAIETGCCVDGERLAYYAQRDTTRPKWQLGATILVDGHAELLHPTWTDWEALKTAYRTAPAKPAKPVADPIARVARIARRRRAQERRSS